MPRLSWRESKTVTGILETIPAPTRATSTVALSLMAMWIDKNLAGAFICQALIGFLEGLRAGRAGGRMRSVSGQPGIEFLTRQLNAIQKALLSDVDIQWDNRDPQRLDHALGQVTGAVRYNFYTHGCSKTTFQMPHWRVPASVWHSAGASPEMGWPPSASRSV